MRVVLDLQGAQTESRYRGIGRYSLGLAKAIAAQAGGNEVWILLSALMPASIPSVRMALGGLVPDERIVTFEAPGPVEAMGATNIWRSQTAEQLRESFLAGLRPDIVHLSSMFEGAWDEAVTSVGTFGQPMLTAVTLYDLIPLLKPSDAFTDESIRQWYLRKVSHLERADLLLAISESARREAIEALGFGSERVVNISSGVDARFSPIDLTADEKSKLFARYQIEKPFVMYSGALEERKNLQGLLQGYAVLPPAIRNAHQLVIVGKHHEESHEQLRRWAKELALRSDVLVFTGYVSDADLVALYSVCTLFVLPSLHEGFGLPALEAMACGAPTIGSNRTSIPEAIGLAEALFDPTEPTSIAERMAAALSNEGFRLRLREHGLRHVQEFTWEKTALAAWNAFHDLYEQRKPALDAARVTEERPRMALISPVLRAPYNPYHGELLSTLAQYYELEIVVRPIQVHSSWQAANLPVRDPAYFDAQAEKYDRLVYCLGNSPLFEYVLELLGRYPGTVLLEDFFIGELLDCGKGEVQKANGFDQELYRSHGYQAVLREASEGRSEIIRQLPCNRIVLEAAAGVVVNSPRFLEMADQYYGQGTSADWIYIPFAKFDGQPNADIDRSRGSAAVCSDTVPTPVATGQRLRSAVEHFARVHPLYRERRLVSGVAAMQCPVSPADSDLAATAVAITQQRAVVGPRQLLLDVSGTAKFDPKTGIQRVTRHLAVELIKNSLSGYLTEPVQGYNGPYTYARRFTLTMLNMEVFVPDEPVDARKGDIFLGVDLCPEAVAQRPFFQTLQARGIPIYFVVHDLLAIRRPDLFSEGMPGAVSRWVRDLSEIADGLICVSGSVADDLFDWLDAERPNRTAPLRIGYFYHGADINRSIASRGLPHDADNILAAMLARPSILMVGTVEPRKGHALSLTAFERLWRDNREVNLVIVGQEGWNVKQVVKRLRSHPELGSRLFWLPDASDEMLVKTYKHAVALLAASEAEGFGLPLIEAAQHGLPIIARDIPIFREVAGHHAFYFAANTSDQLATSLAEWLDLYQAGQAPSSTGLRWLTWQQSAEQLMEVVLGKRVYRTWYPNVLNEQSARAEDTVVEQLGRGL